MAQAFAASPVVVGSAAHGAANPLVPAEETLCPVVANDTVNAEYKHIVLEASATALTARAGQFFNWLCPSPDDGELWLRRPQSVYRVDGARGRIEFLYKIVGRGTKGVAQLRAGDRFNIVGPLGHGFRLAPHWRHLVVLGRGVGLATLAPISALAGAAGAAVTAILSARSPDLVMTGELFAAVGARVVPVLDSDGTSAVANVEAILADLIARGQADAFFTCGSNRLMQLMKRLGAAHAIPGQVAMEQVMACGLGPCYVCVRTFEVDGQKTLRRVCIDGPVFDLQEAVGW